MLERIDQKIIRLSMALKYRHRHIATGSVTYTFHIRVPQCILLWILYGNMVDFSFIVSLYVSDLRNVTISTAMYVLDGWTRAARVAILVDSSQVAEIPSRTVPYRA